MTARTVPDADVYAPPPDVGLELLHVEPAFVVLVKPPGLLSEPGRGPDKRDSLLVRAQAVYPDARIVHRLDMLTSGVIVLARETLAHAALSEAFRERAVDKRYEASCTAGRGRGRRIAWRCSYWPNRRGRSSAATTKRN